MPPEGPTSRRRKPRGYLGKGHETIGSDILAVFQILKMPEQVLGAEEVHKLSQVQMDGWYPIEWLLDLMDTVDKELGQYGLLQMGRRLFALSHEERLVQVARSAADVIYGIDGMYHHANRGSGIGGWKVIRFDPGYAELEKTTPHHCVMEQGILSGALAAVKCPGIVSQKQCFRQGAESCLYVISSSFTDERWFGGRAAPKPAASGSTKAAESALHGSSKTSDNMASASRTSSGSSSSMASASRGSTKTSEKMASAPRTPSGTSHAAPPADRGAGPGDPAYRSRRPSKAPKR